MILLDTSVWADHFRAADPAVVRLLAAKQIVLHRLVVEELALGHLPQRDETIAMLNQLPHLDMLDHDALIGFVAVNALAGAGIGLVDTHLIASSLGQGAMLWARDKRLAAQAQRLGCAWAGD